MMAVGLHPVSLLLANQTFGESDWDLTCLLRAEITQQVLPGHHSRQQQAECPVLS